MGKVGEERRGEERRRKMLHSLQDRRTAEASGKDIGILGTSF
jgi:hypothetical protein